MAEVEISDEMERGCLTRQLRDQDLSEIEQLATTVTEHIKLNEDDEGVELWKKHSIYKVPAYVVADKPEAFKPKVVSIGPYHHGKDHLKPMEVHKQRAARCFILNSGKPTVDYIEALWAVLPELTDSYSQLDQFWVEDRGRFLELMLIDGCFLLEILRICNVGLGGYDEHDPVFSCNGLAFDPNLWVDLYMLENQVPFTAIERLLTVRNDKTPEENCKYIVNLMSLILATRPDPGVDRGLHLLDVARKILVAPKDIEPNIRDVEEDERLKLLLDIINAPGGWVHPDKEKFAALVEKMNTAAKSRSVMELCDAGVKFRAADDEVVALSSIKFENGVLTLPIIRRFRYFEVLACNMVVFDSIRGANLQNAAFFFIFMAGLLTSVEDVRHLRSLKIIQSLDLSDEGILQTFSRISNDEIQISIPFNKLNRVQEQLDEFYLNRTTGCVGRLRKWITNLKQKYFNNPWTFIAVVSATLLLALAMTQTYYTALPYWDSNHKNN